MACEYLLQFVGAEGAHHHAMQLRLGSAVLFHQPVRSSCAAHVA
jgi:hypothetical protein